jgi:[ribosomal protein S18]-alanine N-acetyltransferase
MVGVVTVPDFRIRPMTAADARAVAAWRYPGDYSFYGADADADDLAELLNPAEWGHRYVAADEVPRHELAGFAVVKLAGRVAEIGLGLRPGLTGLGLGGPFVGACLRFAAAALGAQSYTLAVAAFNQRAITVYERAGFREVERFEHFTNGGLHAFIRMAPARSAVRADSPEGTLSAPGQSPAHFSKQGTVT